jgi:hypothetical protein
METNELQTLAANLMKKMGSWRNSSSMNPAPISASVPDSVTASSSPPVSHIPSLTFEAEPVMSPQALPPVPLPPVDSAPWDQWQQQAKSAFDNLKSHLQPALEEVRQQASEQVSAAREKIQTQFQQVKEGLQPNGFLTRSIKEHPIAWAAGSALVGVALARLFVPSKEKVVYVQAPAKKGIASTALGLLGPSLIEMAKSKVYTYLEEKQK